MIVENTGVTEILDDGTIHHFDLDVCSDAANEAIEALWEKENKVINFDFSATMFSVFIESIAILSRSGWTTEDLIMEIYNHSEAEDNVCEICGGRYNDPDLDHSHLDVDDDD